MHASFFGIYKKQIYHRAVLFSPEMMTDLKYNSLEGLIESWKSTRQPLPTHSDYNYN